MELVRALRSLRSLPSEGAKHDLDVPSNHRNLRRNGNHELRVRRSLIPPTDRCLRRRSNGASPHPASVDQRGRQTANPSEPRLVSIHPFRFSCLIAQIGALAISRPLHAEPGSHASDPLPIRKSGVWRISTLSPATGLRVSETCVRAEDGIVGDRDVACANPTALREGDQVVVTIACENHGERVVSSLLFTGDFTTWYRAQAKITFQGPAKGSELHSGFTIDAKFLRPDCSEPAIAK